MKIKLISYAAIFITGWLVASWYYGEDIAQIKLDAEKAKTEAVSHAIAQHNALAEKDRALSESFFREQINDTEFFSKLQEKAKHVQTINDCFVSRDTLSLWNAANRGDTKTTKTGTNRIYGFLQKNITPFKTHDNGSSGFFGGSVKQSYPGRKRVLQLRTEAPAPGGMDKTGESQ